MYRRETRSPGRALSGFRGKSNFPAVLLLFALFGSSCGAAQVLDISPREAAEMLANGDTDFITRTELPDNFRGAVSRLHQLFLIHPGAPFYAGLLLEKDNEGEGRGGNPAALLFCTALESRSLPVRREAAEKLIPLVLTSPQNREVREIYEFLNSRNLKKNNERHLLTLRAACLYRLEDYGGAAEILSKKLRVTDVLLTEKPADSAPDFAALRAGTAWDWPLAFFSSWRSTPGKNKTAAARALMRFLFTSPSGETARWACAESLASEGLFSPEELQAVSSRLSPGDYRTVLARLRPGLLDGGSVFFRHPVLAAELGKACQYVPGMQDEGVELFGAWKNLLETRQNPETGNFEIPEELSGAGNLSVPGALQKNILNSLGADGLRGLEYNILFYLGRLERARGKYAESSEYFANARHLAPDRLQSDSCFWYMLMNALAVDSGEAALLVIRTLPLWGNPENFTDVLDALSAALVGERQWPLIMEVFSAIETKAAPGASLAQYAWIMGRASQEGFIQTGRAPENFFKTAFDEESASFYYRTMAAAKLDLTLIPGSGALSRGQGTPPAEDPELEFILGFFKNGAASFARPYILRREHEFPLSGLRKIARAYAEKDAWRESLNLVSRYSRRNGRETGIEDLRLFYPRPFRELVEQYAEQAGFGAELLYGLVRTESYFIPDAVSHAGAVGLTQLMPATAGDMAVRIVRQGGPDYREGGAEGKAPVISLKNPGINLHIGSYYLEYLVEQMESPILALLAYNGGMGRVRRWRNQGADLPLDLFLESIVITETREYGRRVTAAAAVYGCLYYGMSMEAAAVDIYR